MLEHTLNSVYTAHRPNVKSSQLPSFYYCLHTEGVNQGVKIAQSKKAWDITNGVGKKGPKYVSNRENRFKTK